MCFIVTLLVLFINYELTYNLLHISGELIHISMFIVGFNYYFEISYVVLSNL